MENSSKKRKNMRQVDFIMSQIEGMIEKKRSEQVKKIYVNQQKMKYQQAKKTVVFFGRGKEEDW